MTRAKTAFFYSDSCHHSTFAHCKMPGIVLIQFYFLLVAMKLNTIFYGIICAVGREEFFNEWREALTLGSAVVSFSIVCMIVQPRLLRAKSFCLIKRHWINFKWPQKEGVYTQGFRDHFIIILINELLLPNYKCQKPYSSATYLILNSSTRTWLNFFIFVGKDNTLLSSIHFPSVVMVWFSLIIRNNSCVGEKQSESYNKCEIKKAFCF